jgi:tetratricopeptide (TPR) repeat protein
LTPDPSVDSLMRAASALREAGRIPEAIAAYERLLVREPALPNSWYNLALLLRQARRYDAALAAYQQALDRGVSQPEEVHLNRGVIFADHLRRNADAERELMCALALNPRYGPALLNLGNLQEDRGLREPARSLYESALAADPRCSEALARLAGVSTVADPGDALVSRLRQALAVERGAAERASLGFALGRLLDGCGAHEAAFAAYVQANRDSRASAGPGGARYDRRAWERVIAELMSVFSVSPATRPLRRGAAPPIFVCGMYRSGSTLAEQVLASHARVTAGGELDLLPAIVARELSPFPAAMAHIAPARLERLAADYLSSVAALFPGADIVTDKRPDNYLHIGLIKSLFPDAKIVHTLRNPLDNCLSIYFLHLAHAKSYALDLSDTGHHYRQYQRLMAHWKRLYGDDILDFNYDAFVQSPRPALQTLLGFCGLDWDDACLSFQQASNAVKTASVWQVRQPLYRQSSGRWHHYERHLADLRKTLDDWVDGGPD